MRSIHIPVVFSTIAITSILSTQTNAGVLFSDNFSSYPVSGQTNEWTAANGGPWNQGGNAVYNQILSDNGDQYMDMIVGSGVSQSATLFTPSVAASVAPGQALSFSTDLKSVNFSTSGQLFRIALLPGSEGTPWYSASDGLELYLANGYLAIAGKNNLSNNNGITYNYADGSFDTSAIKSVDIRLTDTQYTVTLTGTFTLGDATNVVNHGDTSSAIINEHSISWTGTHNLPWGNFSTVSGGYELNNESGGAFTADIDNAAISVVPEPASISLLGIMFAVAAGRRRRA